MLQSNFEASFVRVYFGAGIERNNTELSIMQLNTILNTSKYAGYASSIGDIGE